MLVDLYCFTNASYPDLTPLSGTELLHLRQTDLSPDNPLAGLPPLLRVGRSWLGDSSDIVFDSACISAEDCDSDDYNVEWRSDVGNDDVVYASSLTPQAQGLLGATVFQVPVMREWDDSADYIITVLATWVYDNGRGAMPLLATNLISDDEGSSDVDTTHGIRMGNERLPPGRTLSLFPRVVNAE